MKNRYYFFKKLFPEYVIIFIVKHKFKSFGWDKRLLDYIKNNDLNYIIVNSDNSILKYEFSKNNYKKYIIRMFLEDLVLSIRD